MTPEPSRSRVWASLLAVLEHGLLQRDTAARALLLAVLAEEHVLLLGPPGSAKSELARRLRTLLPDAQFFERLLTRFTVPEELFGPLSLKALEEDRYERLTEGYLPSAEVAFLDEVFKANSAILNTLLGLLHERRFDNGSQRMAGPLVCLVGASNEVPQDESLHAFYDRFLLRVPVWPVDDAHFAALLQTQLPEPERIQPQILLTKAVLVDLRQRASQVRLGATALALLTEARERARASGHGVSDRRWRQCAALLQTQAASRGAHEVSAWDAWVLPLVLAPNPEQVQAWRDWFMDKVAQASALRIDGLERAANAFEQQLELEQRAPADPQDDSAGKLALARAMAGPVSESELLRITSERAQRRYTDLHIATRVEQIGQVHQSASELQAQTHATAAAVMAQASSHDWLPPSWLGQIEIAHSQRCEQVDALAARLAQLRQGFAALPRLSEHSSAQEAAPAPVNWAA